jgi:hypothetical protein
MKIKVYDLEAEGGPAELEMWAVDARDAIKNGVGRYAYELPTATKKAPGKKLAGKPVEFDLKDEGNGAWALTADGVVVEGNLDETTALRKLEEAKAKA